MTDYTPTTESIRDAYCHLQQTVLGERGNSAHERFHAEFDRWLADHDRAVAERAWDEGFVECADMWSQQEGGTGPEPDSNPYRKEAAND